MRIFCLNFHKQTHPSIAEAFLGFTPLLQFREPGLLFGDVTKTLWLFKNSKDLLEKLLARAQGLGFTDVSLALSDTAPGAQTLTGHFDFFISEPGREDQALAPLPVSTLKELEGLRPWARPSLIEEIAEFLSNLGLRSLADLMQLPPDSWNLRWGDLGSELFRKISCLEKSTFTPLTPDQPLVAYHHFDFPVHDREWLIESIRPRLIELFFRLEGREQALDQLSLLLVSEYSGKTETLSICPSHKARDLGLIITILRERLKDLSLDNPIREWEIEITPVAASPKQLDFWEPQSHAETENILRLQSLLHDRKIESGFLRVEAELLPEKCWSFQNQPEPITLPTTDFQMEGRSHRELPVFSEGLNSAPRPTQLLECPLAISKSELKSLRFLHRYPLERLDLPWQKMSRDYWIALNPKQQCIWVFRDLLTLNYFLHGYFD